VSTQSPSRPICVCLLVYSSVTQMVSRNMSRRPPDLNFSIGVASARINSLCSLTKTEAFAKRGFLIAASSTACYLYIGKFAAESNIEEYTPYVRLLIVSACTLLVCPSTFCLSTSACFSKRVLQKCHEITTRSTPLIAVPLKSSESCLYCDRARMHLPKLLAKITG
jgi:hypothetical protein